MRDTIEWTNCPICNRPLNPNDHAESVDHNGEIIHVDCVDVAERRRNPCFDSSNSDT
jgi:hypothetical protein